METERTRVLSDRLLGMLTGHVMTTLINIGHRTGLFDAAARGPATSAELAGRAGLDERYVREWLGAMVTGEILDFDAGSGRYTLPAAHAPLLTGAVASNVGPATETTRTLAALAPEVQRCLVTGGGVPYSAYAEAAGGTLGGAWRHIYDEQLLDGFLGAVDGLSATLTDGARVLDLGCGTGHAINLMAQAFPRSEFVGLDLAPEAIALAESERAEMGLGNARFVVGDAAELDAAELDAAELGAATPFDVITAFEAVHDQRAPDVVLRRVHDALASGGVFVMVDAKFSSRLENNIGNPYAPMSYGMSLLFCLPTARTEPGGAALGAMWGVERAQEMLATAGFGSVQVLDSPRAQNCIYVCRAAA